MSDEINAILIPNTEAYKDEMETLSIGHKDQQPNNLDLQNILVHTQATPRDQAGGNKIDNGSEMNKRKTFINVKQIGLDLVPLLRDKSPYKRQSSYRILKSN